MTLLQEAQEVRAKVIELRRQAIKEYKNSPTIDRTYLKILRLYQRIIDNQIDQIKC